MPSLHHISHCPYSQTCTIITEKRVLFITSAFVSFGWQILCRSSNFFLSFSTRNNLPQQKRWQRIYLDSLSFDGEHPNGWQNGVVISQPRAGGVHYTLNDCIYPNKLTQCAEKTKCNESCIFLALLMPSRKGVVRTEDVVTHDMCTNSSS